MRIATDILCAEMSGAQQRIGHPARLTREMVTAAFEKADMVLEVYDELYPEKGAGRGRTSAA